MPTDTNLIPPRPTFDNVFAEWNQQHLDRFGTFVNTATAGAGNYERQVQDLKNETAKQQAQWDAIYGNTPEGKAIISNPPPTWQDTYDNWIKDYKKQFGTDQLNRPWSADADSVAQKQALDNQYLASLDKYNKEHGTNIAPEASVLGANSQPNSFYKQPEKKKGGGLFGGGDIFSGIGSSLADLDKSVGSAVPGGWATLGALGAGGAGLYFAPEIMAAMGAEGAAAMGPTYAELGYIPAAEAAAGGTGAYLTPELMGPTYGELGYTGLAEGAAGPTYAELGYTGLNNQEAIALADAASKSGISFKDAYSTYSRTKQLANILNSVTGMGANRGGFSPQSLASALQPQQEQFGGLYRMNEKPFLSTQQTASLSPESYNVSGQNITSPTTPTNKLLADLLYKEV